MNKHRSTLSSAALLIWVSVATFCFILAPDSIILAPVSVLLGAAAAVYAVICQRFWLAAVGLLVLLVGAICTFVFSMFSSFSIAEHAISLCVLLLIVQAITTFVTLVELHRIRNKSDDSRRVRFSLRDLLVATAIVAVAFAAGEALFELIDPKEVRLAFEHSRFASTSLAMFALSGVSLRSDVANVVAYLMFPPDATAKRRLGNFGNVVLVLGLIMLFVLLIKGQLMLF